MKLTIKNFFCDQWAWGALCAAKAHRDVRLFNSEMHQNTAVHGFSSAMMRYHAKNAVAHARNNLSFSSAK